MNLILIEIESLSSIPKIIQQIKNINADKDTQQTNLFGDNETSERNFDFVPSFWKQKTFD